ncbi:MAG: hypothetical protein ACK5IJ_01930 [Mangrovibacterium sp.]
MKKIIFILTLCFSLQAMAQEKKGIYFDEISVGHLTDFSEDHSAVTFNPALGLKFSERWFCRFSMPINLELDKQTQTYDEVWGMGLGLGYAFFHGKPSTAWEHVSLEALADGGFGWSELNEEKEFTYTNLSVRVRFEQKYLMTIGYNHKFSDEPKSIDGLHVSFGITF